MSYQKLLGDGFNQAYIKYLVYSGSGDLSCFWGLGEESQLQRYKNLNWGHFEVMHDMVGLIMHVDPHCAFLSALPISALSSSRRGDCYLSSLLAVCRLPIYGRDDWHIFNQHNSIPIIAYHHHHIMPTISGPPLTLLRQQFQQTSSAPFSQLQQNYLFAQPHKIIIRYFLINVLGGVTLDCWRLLLWAGLGTRRRGGIGREGMGIDGIFKYLKYKNIRPIQHRFELLSHPQQKGNPSIPAKSTDNSHMNQSAVQEAVRQLLPKNFLQYQPNCLRFDMKESSPTSKRQQHVQVVVRLKPNDTDSLHPKCVYLANNHNQLVVETDNKKEFFVFDHVADQHASQIDIYRTIGEDVVQRGFDGYNCCIFAYGQTGAGKTYSMLGSLIDSDGNYYSQQRGLLPRVIEDVFSCAASHPQNKCVITCSYMEVYNEQIFDLLSQEKRIHQIREDFKRGIFVEGLIEKRITSYRQGIEMLLDGEKTRRMATTLMNNESSRSHAIFTILIENEVMVGESLQVRKAKLNIVDLAGSERVKHTHVMGEQLKEGCNINKSLHVLGNVINSLVESAKKKKHIPFRDSKLTHYLKDSLGGNSITKLLANIHMGKMYLGDTLSTLMFAKRAKILKLKVEVNVNVTENFDSLRNEVKRLREELAQARYFKGDTQRSQKASEEQECETTFEKTTDNPIEVVVQKSEIIQAFEENEQNYKALMEVYEDHLKHCTISSQASKIRRPLNMVNEWKNLEKKNTALANLVKRFPAFTKIFKENQLLKQNISNLQLTLNEQKEKKSSNNCKVGQFTHENQVDRSQLEKVINHYQELIAEMQEKFNKFIETMESSYIQLEHQCKIKDKRLKDFMRAQNLPPEVQDLKNQNEYLHLNILNLQNEISTLQDHENRLIQEKRELKRISHRNSGFDPQTSVFSCDEDEVDQQLFFLEKLNAIKEEAIKEMQVVQREREETQAIIKELHQKINDLIVQNAQLQLKGSRYQSRKNTRELLSRAASSGNLKTFVVTNFQVEQPKKPIKSQQQWQEQIQQIHSTYRRQIDTVKSEIQYQEKTIHSLKIQLRQNQNIDLVQQQFGKDISQILREYRQNRRMTNAKSLINIHQFKEKDPQMTDRMEERKSMKKVGEIKVGKKDAKTRKEELTNTRSPLLHTKKTLLTTKG